MTTIAPSQVVQNGSVLLVVAALTACTTFSDVDGYTDPPQNPDGGGDVGIDTSLPDATWPDSGDPDGSTDSSQDVSTADVNIPCVSNQGPEMARVWLGSESYCVDITEVTRNDYDAFLADKGTDTSGQPAECAWNVSYLPLGPDTTGGYPIAGIDWCDAKAYCVWAGKNLCGRVGGGPPLGTDPASFAVSQWYQACTNEGTTTYPYGSTYELGACNIFPPETSPSLDLAGSRPGCATEAGLLDMVGNTWEWIDACAAEGADPATTNCFFHGGGFSQPNPDTYHCGVASAFGRASYAADVGFRCCSS